MNETRINTGGASMRLSRWHTRSTVRCPPLVKTRQGLCELYPQLLSHSTLCIGARELMNFLGRKLHGKFEGEIVRNKLAVPGHQRIRGHDRAGGAQSLRPGSKT